MKLSLTYLTTIVTTFVILFTIPTDACEQSCRTGISLAFGNNYAIEVKGLFEKFVSNLQNHLFLGFKGAISSTTRSDCNRVIYDEVNKLEKNFTGNFAVLIEDSIFNQTPQFKGQCQHPLRVIQPPTGVAWTMEDCENQDYICGNPPAICHYMDQYVKPRNVQNVKESLEAYLDVNGGFFSSIVKAVVVSGAKSTIKAMNLPSFTAKVEKNISGQIKKFITFFNREFCKGTTCDKYDHDIKVELLSYP